MGNPERFTLPKVCIRAPFPERSLEQIFDESSPIERCHDIKLYQVKPALPHSPEEDPGLVVFAVEEGQRESLSFDALTEHPGALDTFEAVIRALRTQHGEDAVAFIHVGYVPEEKGQHRNGQCYPRGLQTVDLPHAHVVPRLDLEQVPINYLAEETDLEQIALALNLAGKKSVLAYEYILRSFGQRLQYPQKIGWNGTSESYPRIVFAFPSLKEALEQLLRLQAQVARTWIQHAIMLSETPALYGGLSLQLRQSIIPNAAILLPSPKQCDQIGVSQNLGALVSLFPVCSGMSLFAKQVCVIDRKWNPRDE